MKLDLTKNACHVCGNRLERDIIHQLEWCNNEKCVLYDVKFSIPFIVKKAAVNKQRGVGMFVGKIGKEMMIKQGYVPATCTLPDELAVLLIFSEIQDGRDPCSGCNGNRAVCHGRPKDLKSS